MMLRGSLPDPIFTLMNVITALGAIDDSIIGLFNFDIITYLVGQVTELYDPICFLASFCGACLLIVNIN